MSLSFYDIWLFGTLFCIIPLYLKPVRCKWRWIAILPLICSLLLWIPLILLHVIAAPTLRTALNYDSIRTRYAELGVAVGCVVVVFLILRTPRHSLFGYLRSVGQEWLNDWKHPQTEHSVEPQQSYWDKIRPWVLITAMLGVMLFTASRLGDAMEYVAHLPSALLEKKLQDDKGFRTLVYWRGISESLDGFGRLLQMANNHESASPPTKKKDQLAILLDAHRTTATMLLELPARRVDPELSQLAVRLARAYLEMTDVIAEASDLMDFLKKRLAADIPEGARSRAMLLRVGKAALIQWLQACPDLLRNPTSQQAQMTALLAPLREYTDKYDEWTTLMKEADKRENELRLLVRDYSLMRTLLSTKYDAEFPALQSVR